MQELAKGRLPQRRPDLLRRGRLLDFLHQNLGRRLILVCAEAGCGKTTLLVDFAHELDIPICWYSMEASDADPRTFFGCLLASIRQRFPHFGKGTETLLDSVKDVGGEVDALVASLAGEIQSDIPGSFLLMLDDFHLADGSETVTLALDQLLLHMPHSCHLVVSTETLPDLTYSRLVASGQAAGLGTKDLRFTVEELSRLHGA